MNILESIMSYGMVKRMYSTENKFLYEILDDYKDAKSENDKDDILNSFMQLIWSSTNQRYVFQKDIKLKVRDDLIETDIGEIFNMYSSIPYMSYKSMSKDTDFVSLIRQKINNIYTNMCDKRVYIKKEYMDLVKKPKQMYFRWVSGEEYNPDMLTSILSTTLKNIEMTKEKLSKQKIDITWSEYKNIITPFFKRMFDNFIPLEDYEDKNKLTIDIDMWNEDNFAISYLCKGLVGYMRNYQKNYYGLYIPSSRINKVLNRCDCGGIFFQNKKNNKFKCDKCSTYQPIGTKTIKCIDCGKEVEVDGIVKNKKRCDDCQRAYDAERNRIRVQKYRNKNM